MGESYFELGARATANELSFADYFSSLLKVQLEAKQVNLPHQNGRQEVIP